MNKCECSFVDCISVYYKIKHSLLLYRVILKEIANAVSHRTPYKMLILLNKNYKKTNKLYNGRLTVTVFFKRLNLLSDIINLKFGSSVLDIFYLISG